jgi:hypothetical protein
MMAPRAGRGGGAPPSRVTKDVGLNRFVWNVQHSSGLGAAPGTYQVRLTVEGKALTQPLNVLIDPRLAAEGVTAADLKEQFEHNLKMRAMTTEVNALVSRVRDAQNKLRASDPNSEMLKRLDAVAAKLITEPVRYGKPGLQAHISYLAGMTTGADMKIGRDAIARHAVLRKELDAVRAGAEGILGR